MTSVTSLFDPVEADLVILVDNLKDLVRAQHPVLYAAAEHLFQAGGKRMRPAIVLLLSRALLPAQDLTPRHRRLAEITEMIHTASLLHDDVVDDSGVRRGVPSVHSLFGNRIAIQAGDFLFAQASWYLANLDNLEVVKLLSEVIKDFAEGEIQQGINCFDTSLTLEAYLEKSYYKTASLMANSAKAAGVLSGTSLQVNQDLYAYGRCVGLAFQIVDDILDFTGSTNALGKPACSDLRSGNLTAPVLFAIAEKPYLKVLIDRHLEQEEDLEEAIALVNDSQGIPKSRALAEQFSHQAVHHLDFLPASDSRQALIDLTEYILKRLY
ncbi:solanesyl diphosphate synthase [Acaryochloris sp. 'Moss Beach']|uniref:solanesyl diphosphate synthase n=1 Tax=Acaryochloris TaxID=155977 RepID=UPI001BB0AF6C|nr:MULTISPECIES: solanesyl diphosphate synthase [Acaryochloris]QUY44202.1 solanesyl diphosphate synthase [Acaryochloris marina S15]UJB68935.1 solanesyl diphosphate synthase [Acaryochloris sp. 'Moss Beach']